MFNLDIADRKIIRELFENARRTYSEIGRKVRLSKEVVNYRIRRLENEGLIVGYNTIVDVKKIGWEMFLMYLQLRKIDAEKEKKIIDYASAHPHVAWVIHTLGNYDIVLKIFARSQEEANDIVKGMEKEIGDSIDQYYLDYLMEEHAVPFSFLYESEVKDLHLIKKSNEKTRAISATQSRLLEVIAKNARMPFSEIGSLLHLSRDVVKYNIREMERARIILSYRPDTLPVKLDYNWYLIKLKLGFLSRHAGIRLESYLYNQKNVTYFYRTSGNSDLAIELRARTTEEVGNTLMDLRSILSDSLKRHELLLILLEPKFTYFPECMRIFQKNLKE